MKEKKIKIVHFTSGLVAGGVEEMLYNYCKFLDHDKYEFVVAYQHDPVESCKEKIESIGCKTIRITGRNESFVGNIKDSIALIKREKPDIVHAHMNLMNFCALYAAKKCGVNIRISHSHIAEINRGLLFRVLAIIFKWLCVKYATALFTCGEEAGKYLYGLKRMKSGKVILVRNAVDLEYFEITEAKRFECRNELKLHDSFVVGHIGRFSKQKNHERVLSIFKAILQYKDNAILLLVGTGELLDEIQNKANEMGIGEKVKFLGTTGSIDRIYATFDAFLLPSLYEGFPVVSIEIQAANIPALFSDTIAKTCKITDAIQFYSLERNDNEWAEKLLDMTTSFKPCELSELKKLYDIRSKADLLDLYYTKLLLGARYK